MSSPPSFSVVSTFSGCGGSSLGYQLAGGKVLLAVEWDDNAVATYRLNFPKTPIYHGDIAKLSVDECCKLAGIGPGELDIDPRTQADMLNWVAVEPQRARFHPGSLYCGYGLHLARIIHQTSVISFGHTGSAGLTAAF